MSGPSIAEQSVEQLGGPGSLLVRQRVDHAELDALLDRLGSTSGPELEGVLAALYRLVFPHAFAEEAVIWPVVRRRVPGGEALTLRNEREHQQINALLTRVDGMAPDHPERPALLQQAAALLRQDARDEEDLILPRLQAALGAASLRRLGAAWELVRRVAPTRPHPVVSRRPPGNALSAVPLSLLDRSRDRLDALARQVPPVAAGARGADRVLAGLAGVVERLPPARRGENPQTSAG